MRALVATSAFAKTAGSEIVALEMYECLLASNFECDLTAHIYGSPILDMARDEGVNFLPNPEEVRLFDYDVAWIQTQIAPTLDLTIDGKSRARTLCLFAHLDLNWGLAGPCNLEDILGARFMYCSPEAARHFSDIGLEAERSWIFYNAAPKEFLRPPTSQRALRHLTIISNHAPTELLAASDILRERGIEVVHYGTQGGIENIRISPQHMDQTDAIVTIGKSVQYGILSRKPVYIYDHFGGPGWLNEANFVACEFANFSGRCCYAKRDDEEIAQDIIDNFPSALQFANNLKYDQIDRYILEKYVDKLPPLIQNARASIDTAYAIRENARIVANECRLAKAAYGHLRTENHFRNERVKLLEELERFNSINLVMWLPFPGNKEPGVTSERLEFDSGVVELSNGNGWSRQVGTNYRLHASLPNRDPTALQWSLTGLKGIFSIESSADIAIPDCVPLDILVTVDTGEQTISSTKTRIGGDIKKCFQAIHFGVEAGVGVSIKMWAIPVRELEGGERAVIDLRAIKLSRMP